MTVPDPDRAELGGIGIGRRYVIGPSVRMAPPLPEPSASIRSTSDSAAELAHARAALQTIAAALRRRGAESGGEAREILEAQVMMATDPSLDEALATAAGRGCTAARAIHEAFAGFREALAAAGPYLAARVADLDDIRQRAIAVCLGVPVPGIPDPGHPFVLVARDLSPADTASLNLDTVLALVTTEGGPTSHTAVLARSLGIPAVVGCTDATDIADGTPLLVDPAANRIVLHPAADDIPEQAGSEQAGPEQTGPEQTESGQHTGALAAHPGRTADGHPVGLLANIGGPADVPAALAAGAEGVGLYRTELLYLDAATAPDEATQTAAYRDVFTAFPGRRVVVRVLDAGADKPLAFLPQDQEQNPALGVRGLRALQRQPDILRTQLASVAAAARDSSADVWVMAPMVADAVEAVWFADRASEAGLHTIGVMIEVPSAALLADQILEVAAFVSIGTNDLAQYALAVDRQIGGLGALQDPWHPGLLRLIEVIGRAGTAAGKPVGVCGEAAADPQLAAVLVGLGVTSLSMAPAALADVRAYLATVTLAQCRRAAERALAARSGPGARKSVG